MLHFGSECYLVALREFVLFMEYLHNRSTELRLHVSQI